MNVLETAETSAYASAIASVLSVLGAHRQATEDARRVAPESIAALKDAGLTRLLTPAGNGGHEASIRAQALACMGAARACPSASWVMMVCGAHNWVVGSFSAACREEVFEDPGVLIAGTLASQGHFAKADGGWLVSGRWQFCSGVDHAPWIMVGAARGEAVKGPANLHVVVPRQAVQIDDTWHTLGMRGSGSKDIVLDRVFVPEHRAEPTGRLFAGRSPHALDHQTGVYVLPVLPCLATQLAACVLGIAREVLALFIERTRVRPDIYSGKGSGAKAHSGAMQRRVAEASVELTSAELLVGANCDAFDDIAARREPVDLPGLSRLHWRAAYAAELCRRAVERLYSGAGAHAAYDDAVIQQYYRDMMMAARHAAVDIDGAAELEGSLALGVGPQA